MRFFGSQSMSKEIIALEYPVVREQNAIDIAAESVNKSGSSMQT